MVKGWILLILEVNVTMNIIDKILGARGCYAFHCLVKLVIMKLRTFSPHESRRCTINFRVERSKSVGIVGWKLFPDHNWIQYEFHRWSWNFIHLFPISQECAVLILGSKGQGYGLLVMEYFFQTNNWLFHLRSRSFIHLLPMCKGFDIFSLNPKGQDWWSKLSYSFRYTIIVATQSYLQKRYAISVRDVIILFFYWLYKNLQVNAVFVIVHIQ